LLDFCVQQCPHCNFLGQNNVVNGGFLIVFENFIELYGNDSPFHRGLGRQRFCRKKTNTLPVGSLTFAKFKSEKAVPFVKPETCLRTSRCNMSLFGIQTCKKSPQEPLQQQGANSVNLFPFVLLPNLI